MSDRLTSGWSGQAITLPSTAQLLRDHRASTLGQSSSGRGYSTWNRGGGGVGGYSCIMRGHTMGKPWLHGLISLQANTGKARATNANAYAVPDNAWAR